MSTAETHKQHPKGLSVVELQVSFLHSMIRSGSVDFEHNYEKDPAAIAKLARALAVAVHESAQEEVRTLAGDIIGKAIQGDDGHWYGSLTGPGPHNPIGPCYTYSALRCSMLRLLGMASPETAELEIAESRIGFLKKHLADTQDALRELIKSVVGLETITGEEAKELRPVMKIARAQLSVEVSA